MEGIFYFILFFTLCVIVIWVIDALSTANSAAKRQPEIIRKVEEKVAEMSKKKLLFTQFGGYLLKLFETEHKICKTKLISCLNHDFPYYETENSHLFYDLREAHLINEVKLGEDIFELGKSFQNLKLTHPGLIEFMSEKCKNFEYRINITDDWEVFEVEIRSRKPIGIPNIYFAFGACSGKNIRKKIAVHNELIDPKSLYIYGKAYSGNYRQNAIENIVNQHYCELKINHNYEKEFGMCLLTCLPI